MHYVIDQDARHATRRAARVEAVLDAIRVDEPAQSNERAAGANAGTRDARVAARSSRGRRAEWRRRPCERSPTRRPMSVRANQLAGLAAAIERVARLDTPADAALSAFFRAHPAMGQRDRAFIADGVFALSAPQALARSARGERRAAPISRSPSVVRELGHSVRELERRAPARRRRMAARAQVALHAIRCRPRSPPTCPTGCGNAWARCTATPSAPRSRAHGRRRRRSTCASTR